MTLQRMALLSVGGTTLWTPANITTALWLDAADASTIIIVSDAVSQWNDKSGNGRNATQSFAPYRPALTSAGLNGLNVVTFDGTNDTLTILGTTGSSVATLLAVWRLNEIAPTQAQTHSNPRITDFKTGSGGLQLLASNTSAAIHTKSSAYQGSLTATRWFAYGLQTELTATVFQLLATTMRRNGSLVLAVTPEDPVGEAGSVSTLGARSDAASFASTYLRGLIAELVLINSVASTTDIEKAEGYLAHKWGLTGSLPSGHPYKSAPPTV